MDSKSLSEQEKDIRDLLRRAERTPVKTSALRRDTLKRLIDLAHSSYVSLKTIAATNIKFFIKDIPELEDDAINAVYDLCEDITPSVRIKGYAAIVDVSREQNKWVKRNADVLVQLLQSDEPEEVTVVKRALIQHLDMDPIVTIGVLCDQIVPSDEPLDEEEQTTSERLRSLVLVFLAGEAKRPIIDRHATALGTPAEQVLVSGLFKAIMKLPPNDIDFIVKDIIISLPSFRPPSPRGRELLELIIAQIRATLKSDIPSDSEQGCLNNSRPYLELASFITVNKTLAPPSILGAFYDATLAQGQILQRLPEQDRIYVISELAHILPVCQEGGRRIPAHPSNLGDSGFSARTTDISSVLLQTFVDLRSEEKPWIACLSLLQGILRNQRDSHWPQTFSTTLKRMESIPAAQNASTETKAAQEQVHSLIRSLLEPVKTPVPFTNGDANMDQRCVPAEDGLKGNVEQMATKPVTNQDIHIANGTTGTSTSATPSESNQRDAVNAPKPGLDAPIVPRSPATSSRPIPSGLAVSTTIARGRVISLPPRPSPATVAASRLGTPSAPRADRQRHTPLNTPSYDPSTFRIHPAGGSAVSRVDNGSQVSVDSFVGSAHGGKVASRASTPNVGLSVRGAAGRGQAVPRGEEPKVVPSLLKRLAGTVPSGTETFPPMFNQEQLQGKEPGLPGQGRDRPRLSIPSIIPTKRRIDSSTPPFKYPLTPLSISGRAGRGALNDPDKDPVVGFSIRGAAQAVGASPASEEGNRAPGSLLERLQPGDSADSEWNGRRRKRTKHS